MDSLQTYMQEYRAQLAKGMIQKAYKGLMDYMQELKTHFAKTQPTFSVSGSLYFGYMDMTYFAILTETLKRRGLKIAVVFLHTEFRFEVWLSGANRDIQAQTWQEFRDKGWNTYRLVADARKADAVMEHIAVENPDFSDLEALTGQIEWETLKFMSEVERFLETS